MAFTNSPLVSYTNLSPNHYNGRTGKIDTITIHVVVGHLSLETIGTIFSRPNRKASCNYAVDDNGKVGLIVEEKNASWCSSSSANDHRAITIEVASDLTAPYAITDKAMRGLIELCADICKRNGIPKLLWKADKSLIGKPNQQNLTVHRWFAAKSCPGDYIYSRLGRIADEVNKLLSPVNKTEEPPKKLPIEDKKTIYLVSVNTDVLNYRKGPGTNHPIVGQVRKGQIYTIVEEAFGLGASKWGKLKSGAGWVSLDLCKRMG